VFLLLFTFILIQRGDITQLMSQKIIIVGGGTAGWLTAAVIASRHSNKGDASPTITLIESSDIPTVGVGEGTWPTMKNTLKEIGLKEKDVFKHCHAAFKQGGKFVNWMTGDGDFYYHPFTVPLGYGRIDLAPYIDNIESFAIETNFQHPVCEAGLAPRTMAESEYQGPCNYAYHLDAGKFADVLKRHCVDKLAVSHVIDSVDKVNVTAKGSIASLVLRQKGEVHADLFVDCTGFASLLLGKALEVPFKSVEDVLFNDRALAMRVPYESENAPIASHTIATGQSAGWTWDIGLTDRRGVGHVYSSQFTTDEQAEAELRQYIGPSSANLEVRKITFEAGHRTQFWKGNCVAVGMAAGFVEPLEATAIMLVEISARFISDNLPPDASCFPLVEQRFNKQMHYRWQRIVDFLKLHYMLTKRLEPYWQAHRNEDSIPESLKQDLKIWAYRGPTTGDFDSAIELFPAASYQYVLYGMGFKPSFDSQAYLYSEQTQANSAIQRNKQLTEQMLSSLPKHRQYIEAWLASTN
jgi:flavin-dependent dehydrogenase